MIMFRLFQDKSLMVKLFWRVDPQIPMTSMFFGFSNIFIKFSDHKIFLFIIGQSTVLCCVLFVIFMIH